MRTPVLNPSLPPDEVCGYRVVGSPSPGAFIALAEGGRKVFLKPLDTDCLLHGQLHPSIGERLSRVRELAVKSAANLRGVERDRRLGDKQRGEIEGVFLVWEFIEGEDLETHARSLSSAQFISMLREVVLSVDALHQVGIVHGALHARNVIVDPAGRPHLTHISPLLFHDQAVDESAAVSMLARLIEQRPDVPPALSEELREPMPLRRLASKLVASGVVADDPIDLTAEDRRRRRRTVLLALAIAGAGAAFAVIFALSN